MNQEVTQMIYKEFDGFILNDQKKNWRYECVSDIPLNVFINMNRESACNCGGELALLTYKFNTSEIESKKMHGRKCTKCGCNYFTSKTITLCPEAFIVDGNHVNMDSKDENSMDSIHENEKVVSVKQEENFKYLFIDMEWNQKAGTQDVENREPIEIGLIGTDENLEDKKLFSKFICPEDIDALKDETCKMTHTNANVLMRAKTLEDVFQRVQLSFAKYEYVVVWTMSTYELFVQSMNKAGIKLPRHKVLILQEILGWISIKRGQNLGFETALKKAEISYDPSYLHYSKHDVQYMYELFKKIYFEYTKFVEEDSCVINERSKIIHSLECRYAKGAVENVIGKKNLIFKGYRPCSCCGTEDNWRRYFWELEAKKKKKAPKKKNHHLEYRELPLTDENIELICKQFNMKCHIGESIVFLTTNCGCWRVYLVGEEVNEVFHGNYRVSKNEFKKKKKWNEGYHKQNISKVRFYDVVRYIYHHDKYSYASKKKTRVDILLEQIEQERLIKEEIKRKDD